VARVKPWRELSREAVADCRIFTVERSLAVSPVDQSEREYFRVLSGDWVQIVPVTEDGQVVMVHQYRHGSSSVVLEIPGGFVDPGEAPADAAARECREETGYAATTMHSLGTINPNPAIHRHHLHAFYAPDVTLAGRIENTASEQTEVELVPVERLPALLRAGRIDHGLVVATLWRFLADYG